MTDNIGKKNNVVDRYGVNYAVDYISSAANTMTRIAMQQIPPKDPSITRIVALSDTHGLHSEYCDIPECDIFVHAGDVFRKSGRDIPTELPKKLANFNEWLGSINAPHKIVIGGNHDAYLEQMGKEEVKRLLTNGLYLENEFVTLHGHRIYATPLHEHLASDNKAYRSSKFYDDAVVDIETALENQETIDILISHGHKIKLPQLEGQIKLHIWGHLHYARGVHRGKGGHLSLGAANLSECGQALSPAMVIDIPAKGEEHRV